MYEKMKKAELIKLITDRDNAIESDKLELNLLRSLAKNKNCKKSGKTNLMLVSQMAILGASILILAKVFGI